MSSADLQDSAGSLGGLIRQLRLAWRLWKVGRVPTWVKLIPVAGLVYLISPIDLVPDLVFPGLGEVDDVVMLLLALKMFVDFSPPAVVREHLQALLDKKRQGRSARRPSSGPTIDATYRILGEDAEQPKE
jgi:uncharacterized membrane protein YkvA (DUF1232 family)